MWPLLQSTSNPNRPPQGKPSGGLFTSGEGNTMQHEKCVFRSFALPVPTFDYLKEFQRGYERKHGVFLNNNQVLAVILDQHKQLTVESEEHERMAPRAR